MKHQMNEMNIPYIIYIYIYVCIYNIIPVVPHKAVAEVSKMENL